MMFLERYSKKQNNLLDQSVKLDNKEGKGIPDCKEPIDSITLSLALKFVNILRFPNFFITTNTGETQGLVDSSICWAFGCSCAHSSYACNFSDVKGLGRTILKVGLLVPLKDQQLLYPAYVHSEQSVTVTDNSF